MTRDDIIRMAREVGYSLYDFTESDGIKIVETDEEDGWAQLERFAALVAAAEREACVQVCDALAEQDTVTNYYRVAALAIRARGDA